MDDITTVNGLSSTVCFAGVAATKGSVESLPLAHLHCAQAQVSLGDFVRGRMGCLRVC
jgi:hypothetical protein